MFFLLYLENNLLHNLTTSHHLQILSDYFSLLFDMLFFHFSEIIMDSTRNVLDTVFAPATAQLEMKKRCQEIAVKIAESFGYGGIMAIEFFVCKSGI